jgi:hypothetical protein
VLVTDGRSFPVLPILLVMAWTIAITVLLMLWARFDRLILKASGYSGPSVEGIEQWQLTFFLYMRGLDVRTLQQLGDWNILSSLQFSTLACGLVSQRVRVCTTSA